MLDGKNILIKRFNPNKIIIYSRDELLQKIDQTKRTEI